MSSDVIVRVPPPAESPVRLGISWAAFILSFLPLIVFAQRVRRCRHQVNLVGLVGVVGNTFTSLVNIVNSHAVGYWSCNYVAASFLCIGISVSAVGLWTHYILKAKLLNAQGVRFTWLQIISIFATSLTPISVFIVIIFDDRLYLTNGDCVTIPNTDVLLVQGVIALINNILPAVSFVVQGVRFLRKSPELSATVGLRPTDSNAQALKKLIFQGPLINLGTGSTSQSNTSTKAQASSGRSDHAGAKDTTAVSSAPSSSQQKAVTMVRILRHVLAAGVGSLFTTVLINVLLYLSVVGDNTDAIIFVDMTVNWYWAVYASPLPEERGQRTDVSNTTSVRGKSAARRIGDDGSNKV